MEKVCLQQSNFNKLLNLALQNCQSENCKVDDWSNWSNCSAICGGGIQTRNRNIIKNGQNCPTLSQKRSCNTQVCSTTRPVRISNSFIINQQNGPSDLKKLVLEIDTNFGMTIDLSNLSNFEFNKTILSWGDYTNVLSGVSKHTYTTKDIFYVYLLFKSDELNPVSINNVDNLTRIGIDTFSYPSLIPTTFQLSNLQNFVGFMQFDCSEHNLSNGTSIINCIKLADINPPENIRLILSNLPKFCPAGTYLNNNICQS